MANSTIKSVVKHVNAVKRPNAPPHSKSSRPIKVARPRHATGLGRNAICPASQHQRQHLIAGVSELRTTGVNTQGVTVYEQGTPARNSDYVQELGRPVTRYATNGGSTTRRRVRVTETVTIDPQTNEEIVTETWTQPINETNAERIERVRYYDAEIDDE